MEAADGFEFVREDDVVVGGEPGERAGSGSGDAEAVMPEDLRRVWGDDPTGRFLFGQWGAQGLRQSKLHMLGLLELNRPRKARPKKGAVT